MPRLMFTQGIAIAALFCATLPPAASAEEQKYPTKIIATPLSPVTLTNCYGVKDAIGVIYVTNSLINRSSLFLTAYVVRWYAYDNSGVPMGQNDFTYSFQNDLAPGDTTQASQGVYFLTEVIPFPWSLSDLRRMDPRWRRHESLIPLSTGRSSLTSSWLAEVPTSSLASSNLRRRQSATG